jgi:hypothetical protein
MIQSIISGSFLPSLSFGRLADGGILGGGGSSFGGRGTRIINAVDPNLVREFMSSAEARKSLSTSSVRIPDVVQRVVG